MKRLALAMAALMTAMTVYGCSGEGDTAETQKSEKNTTPEVLSDSFLKNDARDYITDIIDENAKSIEFDKESCDVSGEKMLVVGTVAYESDGMEQQGEITLEYEVENNSWSLKDCVFELEEQEKEVTQDVKEDDEENKEEAKEDKEDVKQDKTEEKVEEKTEEKVEEQQEEKPEAPAITAVSDNLYDFQFELMGNIYKLPCKYDDFKNNGWVMASTGVTENSKLSSNTYTWLYLMKDGVKITVDVYNPSGDTKEYKDCKISGIDVDRNALSDVSMFKIAKGINLESKPDEITAAFGAANSTNTYDDYVNISYSKANRQGASFRVYTDGTVKYNTISIENFVKDASDESVTRTEVPEYLSTYTAPTELGTDIMSGIIELDGDIYSLPVPVSEMLSKGWNIIQQPGSVGSGNTSTSIRLERNGKKVYAYVINLAEYQTTPVNCAVYRLEASTGDGVIGKLPGGITNDGTVSKADVEALVGSTFDYYKGSSYHQYSYYDYDNEYSVYIYVDLATEKVNRFYVSSKKWNY